LTGENTLNQTYQIKAPPVGKPIPVEDKRKARVMVYVMVAAVAGAMVWGVWAKIQRDQRAAELAAQGASKTEIKYEENSRVGAIRDALKTLHEYKKSQGDQNPLNENPE
jgi:Flp pilus assembly protein TadB